MYVQNEKVINYIIQAYQSIGYKCKENKSPSIYQFLIYKKGTSPKYIYVNYSFILPINIYNILIKSDRPVELCILSNGKIYTRSISNIETYEFYPVELSDNLVYAPEQFIKIGRYHEYDFNNWTDLIKKITNYYKFYGYTVEKSPGEITNFFTHKKGFITSYLEVMFSHIITDKNKQTCVIDTQIYNRLIKQASEAKINFNNIFICFCDINTNNIYYTSLNSLINKESFALSLYKGFPIDLFIQELNIPNNVQTTNGKNVLVYLISELSKELNVSKETLIRNLLHMNLSINKITELVEILKTGSGYSEYFKKD